MMNKSHTRTTGVINIINKKCNTKHYNIPTKPDVNACVRTTAMSESVLGFSRVIVTFPVQLVTWFCLAINNNTYMVYYICILLCMTIIIGLTRVFTRI